LEKKKESEDLKPETDEERIEKIIQESVDIIQETEESDEKVEEIH